MANSSIKVRAKAEGSEVTVKALFSHEMESGTRKDKKTGQLIPGHYITEVIAETNGKTVLTVNWGGGISKNPYLQFIYDGGKAGDTLKLSWVDNKGDSDSIETKVG
jgi:sulfur-oxidizing protein SoxZ